MDQLHIHLDNLINNDEEDPSSFYTLISNHKYDQTDDKIFRESILPKVYYLYEKHVLRKDLLYLALLSSQSFDLINCIIEYDKSISSINLEDSASIYDYCIYTQKHWVYQIIDDVEACSKLKPLLSITNKLRMLKFIQLTNSININVDRVNTLLSQINTDYLDNFWTFYIGEIHRLIDIAQFCCNLGDGVNMNEVFVFASTNSLILTLSVYLKFEDSSKWNMILDKITQWEDESGDSAVFAGFVIMATVINLIIIRSDNDLKKNDVNKNVEAIKMKLLAIDDQSFQIAILENIFSLLFHRKKEEFVCECPEIRLVILLLKPVIEELQLKKVCIKDTSEHRRLYALHRCITDALWRLDLIKNIKTNLRRENQLINYMLAPPESLIHLCLKKGDFERAYQVIKIFDLKRGDLAHAIFYSERLVDFSSFLIARRKSCEPLTKDLIQKYCESDNENAINFRLSDMFDFVITTAQTQADTNFLLELIEEIGNTESCTIEQLKFYQIAIDISKEIGRKREISISEILNSPSYPLDLMTWRKSEGFYESLTLLYDEFRDCIKHKENGSFNKNHLTHKILLKINETCNKQIENSEKIQLLLKVYNYLQAFSRVLYIEEDTSEIVSKGLTTSYFELLNFNRSELMGQLLFERHLDPTEFERYFAKLKLDFLYHVVGNCFPTINLHVQENVTVEELYHDNLLFIPSKSIIVYIQKRNWLLAFILNEMYKIEGVQINISEMRLKSFSNYLKLPRIQHLKQLFDNNEILTALQNCISSQKVKLYIQEKVVKQDLISIGSQISNNSNDSPDCCETAEEILEDTKTTNWKELFDVVDSIPESQLRKKPELVVSKNNVLKNLIQDAFEPEFYKFVHLIDNRDLRIDTISFNFKKWPGNFVIDIIRAEITRFDAVIDLKLEHLRDWLPKIELCEQLKQAFEHKSWYKTYEFCCDQPKKALEKILETLNIDLLQSFVDIFKPEETILLTVQLNYVIKVIEFDAPFPKIKLLLDTLPFEHTISICNDLLMILRKLEYLEFISEYLKNNIPDDDLLKSVRLSLVILRAFTDVEQDQLYCLIKEPLNILEVIVMNTKFDKLATVLDILSDHYDDEVINVKKIDQLLRNYAEKSLDFRVVTQPNPRLLRTPEHKLLQSVDSLNLNNDRRSFVMPAMVPHKDEWVRNEEVLECMCCQMVTFSMFNRRHHCRRCGRVVCYSCSLKRMSVDSYGDIMVRVCADCYEQTIGSSFSSEKSEAPSLRSFHEYWLLNDDPEHNKIMREEFSYEHAPSVSLCLSILRYHSKNVECPKFLLEQCEFMLRLLQPNHEPTQEIDYLLVIKMLKSLAMAAKMLSAEHSLNSGISTADRILSQAELLGLLAERGCLSLMPVLNTQGSYVDATILRRLRDKLLQREQWDLALEVSTKAGLDSAGIFAAWGKSCLKAGSLALAREKFQRCLDKTSHYETSSTLSRLSDLNISTDSLNRSRFSSKVSNVSSMASDSVKPAKDPAILCEIIRLLESQTQNIHPDIIKDSGSLKSKLSFSGSLSSLNMMPYMTVKSDSAIIVLNRIKNLKEIATGKLASSSAQKHNSRGPKIDPIFYGECVYYLTRYGTHLSLLEFFIRHGDIDKALNNLLENKLCPDMFVEIYLKCLKDGIVHLLQENMAVIDCSLEVWREYIKQVCRHLEKNYLLNSLYQLQLFIGDFVRAAMTCIRFYLDNVNNFTELSSNVSHLLKAEEHLKQVLEQEQWVEVSSIGRSSIGSKDSFEEKLLSNSSLIMKIDAKDVAKHLKTIKRQIEVVEFLSKYENQGVRVVDTLKDLFRSQEPDKVSSGDSTKVVIPSLFGGNSDKIHLTVLVMICGPSIDQGFELASSLIQEFKLRQIKVYCLAGRQLAQYQNYSGISQLVSCIKSSGVNDSAISDMLDEMLTLAIGTLIKANVTGTKVEDLIKLIKDRATRISAYIEAKQLKTAYFLAVKYKRTADIRRIQREAELLNLPNIKALCSKVLQNYSQSSSTRSQDDVL